MRRLSPRGRASENLSEGFYEKTVSSDPDLSKSLDELVADLATLHEAVGVHAGRHVIGALKKFACILVAISKESEKQNEIMVTLTRRLHTFTIVLTVVAVLSLIVVAIQLFR